MLLAFIYFFLLPYPRVWDAATGKKLSDLRHAVRDRCNLQVERFHPFVTFSKDKRVGRTEIYDIPTKGQY